MFVAPFTFDEACAAADCDASMSLKRLIDASLVQMRLESGTPEYYLLDSTRDFARERLQSAGEIPVTCRALLAYHARLAYGSDAERVQLECAFPNVANALTALTGDEASSAQQLSILAAAGIRFGMLGHVDETAALCDGAIQSATPAVRATPVYVDALRTLAWFDNRRGRFQEALTRSSEAFEAATALNDMSCMARARSMGYIAATNNGDYDSARQFSDEALTLARICGDARVIANALRAAGGSRVAVGDFTEALPFYEELLDLDITRVPSDVLALAMHDYAMARLSLGSVEVARTLAQRCSDLSEASGDYNTQADAQNALGAIALGEGDLQEALKRYRSALAIGNRRHLNPITTARSLEGCAASALRDDQLETAAQILGHCEQIRLRIRSPRNPFERDKAHALHAAFASRLGKDRFEAALLAGRTKTFGEIRELVAGLDAGSAPPEQAERFAGLTPREREIAVLAAAGSSNRDISAALHLSVRTVENHLAAIYRKLGIQTRDEL